MIATLNEETPVKTNRLQFCQTPREFRARYREASLNWLALGMLLAAWNAVDRHPPDSSGRQANLEKGHKTVNQL